MNEKQIRLANRIFGLFRTAFVGGLITSAYLNRESISLSREIIAGEIGLTLIIDGVGDLITGQHHYLSSNIIKYISERRNRRYLL